MRRRSTHSPQLPHSTLDISRVFSQLLLNHLQLLGRWSLKKRHGCAFTFIFNYFYIIQFKIRFFKIFIYATRVLFKVPRATKTVNARSVRTKLCARVFWMSLYKQNKFPSITIMLNATVFFILFFFANKELQI